MNEFGKVVLKRAVKNSTEHGVVKGVAKTGGEVILSVLGVGLVVVFILLALMNV